MDLCQSNYYTGWKEYGIVNFWLWSLYFIIDNLRLGQGVFDQKWGRLNWLRRMEKNHTMKIGGNTLENLIEIKYGDSVNHNSTIPCWGVWLMNVMANSRFLYPWLKSL